MSKSNTSFIAILSVLLLLLLGLVGYQYYQITELKDSLSISKSKMIENEKVQAELNQDYQSALDNLEELRGTNADLNALIDNQKAELTAQKKKVSGLIWTKGELDKARAELEIFRTQAAGYAAQVRELSAKNADLTQVNTQLSVSKTQLETAVANQTETINSLNTEKKELTELKASMEKKNSFLSDKVSVGQVVKVNDINVKAYKLRNNRDAKETTRAKNTDYLNACIKTESNLVVDPGDETFYIRLISPGGETISDSSKGAGVVTNVVDDSEVRYTMSTTNSYSNEVLETCIDYDPGYVLPAGNYTVEAYNKGYLVGSSSFFLK